MLLLVKCDGTDAQQIQFSAVADLFEPRFHGVHIRRLGLIPLQAQHNGLVAAMSFPGRSQ